MKRESLLRASPARGIYTPSSSPGHTDGLRLLCSAAIIVSALTLLALFFHRQHSLAACGFKARQLAEPLHGWSSEGDPAARSWRSGLLREAEQQDPGDGDKTKHQIYDLFPQVRRCSNEWLINYSRRHQQIRSGQVEPYYFVSVSVAAGLADRILGMVTQFYVAALLQNRAFIAHNYGVLPNFNATCQAPYFDWLTPLDLPDDVIEPVMTSYRGLDKNKFGYGIFPRTVNLSMYSSQVWINCEVRKEEQCDVKMFHGRNLTDMPKCNSRIPFIISTSNRGYTYALANNPYHRAQFFENAIRPEEAFMCGFFSLCYPTEAVLKLYHGLWEVLTAPDTFTIGIQVRFGDDAMADGARNHTAAEALLAARAWFDCASKLEDKFAPIGQRVIWFLISDSHELRRAATDQYGRKVLTESQQKVNHVACQADDPALCDKHKLDLAFQNALATTLAFSLTQYQIITQHSGFGRMGAWLSGRWNNIYTIIDAQTCNPGSPTSPNISSSEWSGI